jgi:2,3-bisphosphoglycerate-independent phosphoglycerate mutase
MLGKSENKFKNIEEYINSQYKNNIFDEFIKPAINSNFKEREISINDNDGIINFNYRPDRVRQISHLIFGSKLYDFKDFSKKKNIFYVTMMKYDGIKPSAIAFPPLVYKNTLGEVIAKNNLNQLRIAETEKYAHVTFFFDGGKEVEYKNEKKILIPSPKVATYDLQPEMSAYKVTDELIKNIKNFDLIICNYANGDMVGHTGKIQASIKAVEAIDKCVGKIYDSIKKNNDITLFITADHGNVEEILDKNNNPITSHTTNLVPFLITDKKIKFNKNIIGKLSNIAPTILKYLNIKKPSEMDQESLC